MTSVPEKFPFHGRKWEDIAKEINLELGNKLPGDGRSDRIVSVLL
jgi:hypothetical protein